MEQYDVIEVEPTYVYPIKENHVYAVCRCEVPIEYVLDLGERIPNKIEYHFICKKCRLKGCVVTKGELI